jgi:hypothetical protein
MKRDPVLTSLWKRTRYWIPEPHVDPKTRRMRSDGWWATRRAWTAWVYSCGWRDGLQGLTKELLIGDVALGAVEAYVSGNRAGRAARKRLVAEGKRRARAYARSK